MDIFDEITERFNCEETEQDKRAFLFDVEELVKVFYKELENF